MKESVVRKLEHLVERFEEVQALLGDPGVIGDQDKFRNLSKEFSQLEDVVAGFNAYQQAQENLASAQEMLNEDDAEMREMAQEEMKDAKAEIERLETELQVLLLPKDPNDDNNCFLEIGWITSVRYFPRKREIERTAQAKKVLIISPLCNA